jgi:hypothetical protein
LGVQTGFVKSEGDFIRMKKSAIFFLVLFNCLSIVFMSCAKKEEPSVLEIKRLQARNEVQNLMGRFAFYQASGMNFRAAEQLFTTYNDTVIELPRGRYTGKDAAYRAYTVGYRKDDQPTIDALKLDIPPLAPLEQTVDDSTAGSPTDAPATATAPSAATQAAVPAATAGVPETGPEPAVTEAPVQGIAAPTLHVRGLTTPVIEVAGDCETARAVWLCPGLEGMTPTWTKFGCDFKRQDGEWKIWHLHAYGLATGLEMKESFTPSLKAEGGADKPPTTSWEYSNSAKYIPLEPEPPKPYATWDYTKIQPKSYGDPE